MNYSERKVFLQAKLRNLKRKHAKLAQYPEMADEYFSIGKQINEVEDEINLL